MSFRDYYLLWLDACAGMRALESPARGMLASCNALTSNALTKKDMESSFLRRLFTPGAIPRSIVTIGSFLAILAIFPLDLWTGSEVVLQFFYFIPIAMIAFHEDRSIPVIGAAALSVILQDFVLLTYDISTLSKLIQMVIVLFTNALTASLSRYARGILLEHMRNTSIDQLTGLLNRRSLEIVTDNEVRRQQRHGGTFSVVVVALDNLGMLNVSQGHARGDQALKIIAEVLTRQTRKSDTVARVGGGKFAVLMPGIQPTECAAFCQKLSAKIASMMANSGLPISTSITCEVFEQPSESAEQVFKKLDQARRSAMAERGKAMAA
jgi:diguanylate cyclase (GGDEF)-like protein